MNRALGVLRSVASLLGIALLFTLGGFVQRLIVFPLTKLFPARRQRVVRAFMRGMSGSIFAILRMGGARKTSVGVVPTGAPALVLMNHQSLLDVPNVILMSDELPPLFVTRRRYARFVPVVSLCLRLAECPIIEPRERRAALDTLRETARQLDRALLIFPEGHRTEDGLIREFRTAGTEAMLRERALPVYVVVTDGFWSCRRLVDFVMNVHRIQGHTEVMGPFVMTAGEEPASFLRRLRTVMVDKLAAMRGLAEDIAAAPQPLEAHG
jgi:1-acyl-sn-glycerol-3-phosphate acyltransferase